MEVGLEPNIVSDRIKAFLDDPHWSEHIENLQLKHNQETNFFDKN